MSMGVESIFHLASSPKLKFHPEVCNDVGRFAFDCEMLLEIAYPLLVVAGICTCHNSHKVAPSSTLTRL